MAAPRLFLVDDDREYCADLEAMLGGKFRISMAHDGREALDALDRIGPDVILLDVDFGDGTMGGLEVLERIRSGLHRGVGLRGRDRLGRGAAEPDLDRDAGAFQQRDGVDQNVQPLVRVVAAKRDEAERPPRAQRPAPRPPERK